jgi:hypothetical protein
MKNLFAAIVFGLLFCSSLVTKDANADYTERVWHDGYYWIRLYTDDGDLVNEYIDVNQD